MMEEEEDDGMGGWGGGYAYAPPPHNNGGSGGGFSACEALFLPAAFAKLKAKYAKLEMDARASLAPNGENRVAVEEEKLRQRRALDAKVVEDAEKEWRIRFTKEQIGFGSTARQSMASGSMRERR